MPGHTSAKRQSSSLETITPGENIQPIQENSDQKTNEPKKTPSKEKQKKIGKTASKEKSTSPSPSSSAGSSSPYDSKDKSTCEHCPKGKVLKIVGVLVLIGVAIYAFNKYGGVKLFTGTRDTGTPSNVAPPPPPAPAPTPTPSPAPGPKK